MGLVWEVLDGGCREGEMYVWGVGNSSFKCGYFGPGRVVKLGWEQGWGCCE